MVGTSVPWWIPLVSVVIGSVGLQLAEFWRDRRHINREIKIRQLEAQQKKIELREEFQLKTLLELFEALELLSNSVTQCHLDIINQGATEDTWKHYNPKNEHSLEKLKCTARLRKIQMMILDKPLRELLLSTELGALRISVYSSSKECSDRFSDFTILLMDSNIRASILLRRQYRVSRPQRHIAGRAKKRADKAPSPARPIP